MKHTNHILALTLMTFSLYLPEFALNAQYFPDKDEWQHKTPAESGMDDSELNAAVEFAQANE